VVNPNDIMTIIGAHGAWKMKLRNAIISGQLDKPVEIIASDSHCAFGRWLATISEEDRNTPEAKAVQLHHTAFHRIAGKIAEHALSNEKVEAVRMLDTEFKLTSDSFKECMIAWKNQK